MRKLLLLALIVLAAIVGTVGATELADYGNYTTFYLNNTVGAGAQTGYQVKFILSNSSGVSGYYAPDNIIYTNRTTRADWFDINATDGSNNPLPFWVENHTATAYNITAWVRVPTIATDNTSTGRWHYGNSTQSSSTMNGYSTFQLFDDFNAATLNASQWQNTSIHSISSGVLTSYATSSTVTSVGSIGTYPVNTSLIAYAKFAGRAASSGSFTGYGDGGATQSARVQYYYDAASTGFVSCTGTCKNLTSNPDTSAHKYEVIRNGTVSIPFMKDNAQMTNSPFTYTVNISALSIPINLSSRGTGSTYGLDTYWVAVRNYTYPEPITSAYTRTPSTVIPVAAFSCSPTAVELGGSTTCTDTSTGPPADWYWEFGDGNTSTSQNPTYIYPFIGTFNVSLKANNSAGFDWENKTDYITVTNATGFVEQDIWMTGQYLQTFNIIDSSTNLPIAVTTLTSSNGNSFTTSNGTGYLTEPFGVATVTFVSTGYTSRVIQYVFDSDDTHTVRMVPTSAASTNVNLAGTPKAVQFHVQSFWGTPIVGATIAVQGVTTSLGSWDWLGQLTGIALDETPIANTSMNTTTDSNGNAVFMMLSSVKYNITTSASGYTFPTTFIAPQANQYVIIASANGSSWFATGNNTLQHVNVSVQTAKINATHSWINTTYDDTDNATTGGNITIYKASSSPGVPAAVFASCPISSNYTTNGTIVTTTNVGMNSYNVNVTAANTIQNVDRTFAISLKGAPLSIAGFDSKMLLWLCIFIMIFTAMFAGIHHAPQMAIVICVEGWLFWAAGWLDALPNTYGAATEYGLLVVLTVASALAVWWNIVEGKAKIKRSS